MRVPQGAPAVSMCVLSMAADVSSVWLDTSTNLHAITSGALAAAEGEVAPRDVLEHVRRGSSRPLRYRGIRFINVSDAATGVFLQAPGRGLGLVSIW